MLTANHRSHPGGTYVFLPATYPFMYFPIIAVRYPESWRSTASVCLSSKASNPPWGPTLDQTPVVCAWFPVKVLARLGQHTGSGTKAFVNAYGFPATSRSWICGVKVGVTMSHR